MEQDAHALLASWEAFNVIVGPTAAVLIGLQFLAITLSAEGNTAGAGSAIDAFSTPTDRPLLCRAVHCGDAERTLACALTCRPASGRLRSGGARLHATGRAACAAADCLCAST